MVTVKEKTTVTQRIRGNCPTHSRTEISVRDVKAVIDEPKEREGTNMGPTPTETMVAALIACTNVISHKCAKRHGVELKVIRSTPSRLSTAAAHSVPELRTTLEIGQKRCRSAFTFSRSCSLASVVTSTRRRIF